MSQTKCTNDSKTDSSTTGTVKLNSEDKPEESDSKDIGMDPIPIDRDEYLAMYKELLTDRTQQIVKNNILHKRMAEYYKKRKLEHVLKPHEGQEDIEEKYHQKLYAYEDLKDKELKEVSDIKVKLGLVQGEYTEHLGKAKKKFQELQSHERSTGSGLIFSKKGKAISDKTVSRFLQIQRRKMEQACVMYLKYLRVRNAVIELEGIVKKLERIAPGLYVAQYEQLRVDKVNFTNKLEEREDELIKNRTRCTEHNQILAHIREKMHHTDEIIDITECDLGDAEIEYQRAREDLSQVKSKRDKLRWALESERAKAGLLTRKDLLHDYQDAVDLLQKLRERKARLETGIAKMSAELKVLRADQKSEEHSSFISIDFNEMP